MTHELTTIVPDLHFSECPRWRDGRLWFSDFYLHRVHSCEADGSDLRVEAEVPEQPSGLGWLPDGRLLVVSQHDQRILRREHDGTLMTHAELADHVTGDPNDMVVDDQGRAYVGSFGFDLMGGAASAPAGLVRIDPDGTVTSVADGLHFPNGSVITPDGRTLIVDETFGNRISAFTIADDGSLTDQRVWAELGPLPTTTDVGEALETVEAGPDGCGLDADGLLWVADAVHGRVIRVREGGEIVEQIDTPMGVYACMLGGDDGRTLFLCCAPDFLADNRRKAAEAAILTTTVEVPHAGRP
jgi:sugar lactone lactonase YvrE